MAFNSAVLQNVADLPAGEVITASPYNVSAFETFENGLIEGRFVKFDTESIAKRKVTGEIGTGIYSTTGDAIDSVAEVINFGFATVTVTAAATPARYDAVNVVNAATAEAGKATDAAVAAGIISAGDVVFWELKSTNVWLVRINKYL